MLELTQAVRSAGREPLLSGVEFVCTRENPTSLLGLSPAGRDVLIRLLSGMERLQGGEIRLDGRDSGLARRTKMRIVRVGPEGAAKSGQKVGKIIDASLALRVGLSDRLAAPVSALDAEERVRLSIAKAQQEKPALLLLNAPASNLAPVQRARFSADLGQMVAGCGAVVVLAASGADEALGLGGDTVVLADGRVQQAGPVTHVCEQPANFAAALATAWPVLNTLAMTMDAGRGRLRDGASLSPPEGLALPEAGPCTLAFRPNFSTMTRETPGCMRFVVRAIGEEEIGGQMYKRLAFAGAIWLSPLAAAAPPLGAVLNLFVDRGKVLVFDKDGAAIPQTASSGGAARA